MSNERRKGTESKTAEAVCDGHHEEARRLAELFYPKGYGKHWKELYKWYCDELEPLGKGQTAITDFFKKKVRSTKSE